jgi:hypothetical protein
MAVCVLENLRLCLEFFLRALKIEKRFGSVPFEPLSLEKESGREICEGVLKMLSGNAIVGVLECLWRSLLDDVM